MAKKRRKKKKNNKKLILVFVIVLAITLLVGGILAYLILNKGNEEIELKAEDVNKNTLLVNDTGLIQSALVEDFDKDYYKLDELKDFVKDDLEKFNSENDTDVEFKDSAVHDNKVALIFEYKSISEFAKYAEVKADIISPKDSIDDGRVAKELVEVETKNNIPKDRVFEDEDCDYTVVVLEADDSYNIVVNGKILYYSNVEIKSDNKVACKKGRGVVVFK